MSLIFTLGRYGGFYLRSGYMGSRLCLGFLSIDLWYEEVVDDTIYDLLERLHPNESA